MKKVLSVFALFSACAGAAWAAPVSCLGGNGTCDAATRYDVNVQEVALCQDSACTSSYVVGSGARTFDIASAAVGTAIGSYAKVDGIPVGVYTHVRTIISRTFTISGPAIPPGVGTCTAKTAASLSIPNGAPIDAITVANVPGMTWDDGAKSKVRMIMALPSPIAISKGGTRPAVTVKFDTQQGLMCAADNNNYPAPPTVTISVNQ